MDKGKKQVVIVAGANGSGKTTFARKFLDVTKFEFLNADEIAKELNPKNPIKARIAAGKKVINSIDQLIQEEKNFVIESTLSGSFLEKHIQELKIMVMKLTSHIFSLARKIFALRESNQG